MRYRGNSKQNEKEPPKPNDRPKRVTPQNRQPIQNSNNGALKGEEINKPHRAKKQFKEEE